jgi:hypothetical protein
MLSPNAVKVVLVSRGGGVTVTWNEHDVELGRASRAVQLTVAWPTGSRTPLSTEQVVVTGALPPLTTGAWNDTATGLPSGDATV